MSFEIGMYRKGLYSGCSTLVLSIAAFAISSPGNAQTTAAPAGTAQQTPNVAAEPGEIVVTAQRRTQRITDVPYNISAVSSAQLTASGTSNGNDIGKVIVGLNTVNEGPVSAGGNSGFTLRGLRSDPAGPSTLPQTTVNSVSTYFGDTPLFFSILLKDIERVEVLRGPQGTLYGSGAEGGTIRFIPARPKFDKFSGEINASGSYTDNAVKGNYSADGVVNIPLADNLAVRVVGAYTRQAGFIDKVDLYQFDKNGEPTRSVPGDITSGPIIAPVKRGANNSEQWQVRGELRWQPTDWLDMEVDYLHQRSHIDDRQYTNPTYVGGLADFSDPGYPGSSSAGQFPNSSFTTRSGGKLANTENQLEPITATLDLISGTAAADLGFATLTSVTSYSKAKTISDTEGSSAYFVQAGSGIFSYIPFYNYYPRFTAPTHYDGSNKGFTEEVRLVSKANKPLSYVLGLYYEKRNSGYSSDVTTPGVYAYSDAVCTPVSPACVIPGANPQLGDSVYTIDFHQKVRDVATFGEVTYRITPKWQITGGFRFFWDKVNSSVLNTAPFLGELFSDGVTLPLSLGATAASSSESIASHIFKANTAYNFNKNTKVYATYSRGFRHGGANTLPTAGGFASLPLYTTYQPDFADNYEIGFKGLALHRKFSYSISAFLINLKKFQIDSFTPAELPVVLNGDEARSKGIEAEFSWQATRQLALSAGYTYTDSKVTKGSVFRDLAPGAAIGNPANPVIIDGTTIAKGARLPGVSKHTLLASADYSIPIGHGSSVILHGNMNYRSSQNSAIDTNSPNFAVIPGTTSADLRITFDSGKSWSASVFVNNVGNAIGYSGVSGLERNPYLYQKTLISTPRTVGAQVHLGF
jgi:outer membrane receptor protein involved in Fe transport